MKIEIMTLDEKEEEVIRDAIEYVQQLQHGRYRDVCKYQQELIKSVEKLVMEHDGRWEPQKKEVEEAD